ncbi:DUF1800 domain-containing protein [Hymenobacter psychrophilus]|uniref:Uncharacterized conserved protein, DUF1800 family n=1 Tax=Hymenobacter psychrophilus TaxID=651662 RepID=A0A1H3JF30_9BACT|nr:DUF1800 domain-containing protein [Hymenobacter psychrophilus]SDY38640.1 Uncharacterized conserved protein, DUF1800 family [Hymenobacter psychrophilus]
MDRRAFFRKSVAGPAAAAELDFLPAQTAPGAASGEEETVSKFANRALPDTARATGTLAAYTGPWGAAQAAHLLRRATFGPTRAEILAAAGKSLAQVLDGLLAVPATPAPPVNGFQNDTSVPVGQSWVTAPFNNDFEYWRLRSLRAWWMGQQLQSPTLTEKMTLFWHNHFVAEFDDVFESRYAYRYVALLRRAALGNIRQLAKDVTIEPMMLRYLGGNQNRVGAPNENYGRELLELFTVGKGPLIGAGNYTTYTEADVQAAAKVLTGWQDSRDNINGFYTDSRHDKTTKQFSAAFGNKTITNQGDQEYKALVDLVFDQPSTALFLVRKLYRWFVYYVIDADTEQTIIQPLAADLRQNGYNVAPVLRKLLGSQHFFDVQNVGCVIKSPLDAVLSAARQLPVSLPPASDVLAQYGVWDWLVDRATVMQQKLGDPPNVAGWPAYWQTPEFYEMWINAVTLPRRNQYTDQLIDAKGYTRYYTGGNYKLLTDIVGWVQALPTATAADPNLLVGELVRLLVPVELTANQLAFLNDTLIPGLPDFEWTVEWNAYLAAPTNATKKAAVDTKLRALTRQLMGLAEYHIS